MDIFSLRNRFFQKDDDTLALYPYAEMGKKVAALFIALYRRMCFLLTSMVVLLITVLFVDSIKLKALQSLHTQDLCDSIKKV